VIIIGTLAIVAVTIAAGVVLDRRYGIVPRAERLKPSRALPVPAPGEAAATPLEVADVTRVPAPRCCTVMERTSDDVAIVGQRQVTVVRFRCPRCDKQKALYVVAREG
jgi:hypothetical protein